MKTEKRPALPDGIENGDLKRPDYEQTKKLDWQKRFFELWYTAGAGWVLPTLDIRAGKRGMPRRTYAVDVNGKVWTVGQGPHVTQTLVVYATHKSAKRLAKFFDLIEQGKGSAGEIRDRISSRRAQGQIHRAARTSSWSW